VSSRHLRLTAPLAAALIALAAAGCGSDDSGDTTAPTVSIPTITSPLPTATSPTTTPTATAPTTTTTSTGTRTFDPNQPDSATNDVPPKPGSPAEAFEKQCEAHPEACG
jgi:hypothetical protein